MSQYQAGDFVEMEDEYDMNEPVDDMEEEEEEYHEPVPRDSDAEEEDEDHLVCNYLLVSLLFGCV